MTRVFKFDKAAYRRVQMPGVCLVIILSILIDLALLWIMTLGKPPMITAEPENIHTWQAVMLFFIMINTLVFTAGSIYYYFSRKRNYQNGYIKIDQQAGIEHCLEKSRMTRNEVKRLLGYGVDEDKQFYEIEEIYFLVDIQQVTKNRFGSLLVTGKINLEVLDEQIALEMGTNGQGKFRHTRHSIPAYYEEMIEIQKILETAIQK